MIILLFCLFIVTINQTIVSIAGPSILADLGGFKYYSWIFSGTALTAAICSPITGKLYELYGAKKIIISFLLIFTVAILFCGLSNSMFSLIVFRTLQGAGIGGVYGIIWIMTASLWNPNERGKWVGIATASFTVGTMVGPIMGGYISEIIGWRWIFFFNLPLSLILMTAIFIVFPNHEKTISRKFDYKGTIVFIFFVSSFLIGISNIVQDNSYIYINSIILFLASFGSLGLFIYIENKEKENALIDLSLFKYK
ncbi:MAG: MFS transporter, partial [SAR202 cluster bacterium]|nr:MFS transporter [SAR202 cluster bacterium]